MWRLMRYVMRLKLWLLHEYLEHCAILQECKAVEAAMRASSEIQLFHLEQRARYLERKIRLPRLSREQEIEDRNNLCILREQLRAAREDLAKYGARLVQQYTPPHTNQERPRLHVVNR